MYRNIFQKNLYSPVVNGKKKIRPRNPPIFASINNFLLHKLVVHTLNNPELFKQITAHRYFASKTKFFFFREKVQEKHKQHNIRPRETEYVEWLGAKIMSNLAHSASRPVPN